MPLGAGIAGLSGAKNVLWGQSFLGSGFAGHVSSGYSSSGSGFVASGGMVRRVSSSASALGGKAPQQQQRVLVLYARVQSESCSSVHIQGWGDWEVSIHQPHTPATTLISK